MSERLGNENLDIYLDDKENGEKSSDFPKFDPEKAQMNRETELEKAKNLEKAQKKQEEADYYTPISVKRSERVEKTPENKKEPYFGDPKNYAKRVSPVKKAKQDTILGTAFATAGGAAFGSIFAGASIAAPIVPAVLGGAAAFAILKRKEKEVIKKEKNRNW